MMKNGQIINSNGDKHWFKNGQLHREDGPAIEEASGNQYWFKNGKLHNETGPAVIRVNGELKWYINGINTQTQKVKTKKVKIIKNTKKQPVVQPKNGLIINDEGDKLWYVDGKLHNETGPAVESINGDKHWYINGLELTEKIWKKLYAKKTFLSIALNNDTDKEIVKKLNGLVIDVNGDKRWYVKGQLHNETGPAVILTTGERQWFKNGQLHRLDGPAIEEPNGNNYWFAKGRLHNEEGPAIERDGEIKWYLNGVQLSPEGIEKVHLEKALFKLESTNKKPFKI